MRLNTCIEKCHAMRVHFGKTMLQSLKLTINNQVLQQVEIVKVLGVFIQADLKWDKHIHEIVKKANIRMHMLRQLVPFNLPRCDLITIYTGYIRPLLEYAAPVWHSALTRAQTNHIEKVQKRVLRLILGSQYQSYEVALNVTQLETLDDRRNRLCLKFAQSLAISPQFCHWLPLNNETSMRLRNPNPFKQIMCRTERYRTSPIPSFIKSLNNR